MNDIKNTDDIHVFDFKRGLKDPQEGLLPDGEYISAKDGQMLIQDFDRMMYQLDRRNVELQTVKRQLAHALDKVG